MTMKSTLPLGPLSSSFRAAILLLARQSLTPLSRTAFCEVNETVLKQGRTYRSYPGGAHSADTCPW